MALQTYKNAHKIDTKYLSKRMQLQKTSETLAAEIGNNLKRHRWHFLRELWNVNPLFCRDMSLWWNFCSSAGSSWLWRKFVHIFTGKWNQPESLIHGEYSRQETPGFASTRPHLSTWWSNFGHQIHPISFSVCAMFSSWCDTKYCNSNGKLKVDLMVHCNITIF